MEEVVSCHKHGIQLWIDYMSNIDVAANAIHIISEESINGWQQQPFNPLCGYSADVWSNDH